MALQLTKGEQELVDLDTARSKSIADRGKKVVNLNRMKCTDMGNNTRVTLPDLSGVQEEVETQLRVDKFMETCKNIVNKQTNKNGEFASNLTNSQRVGLKCLQDRSSKQELVVCPTYKSERM